MVNKPEKDEKVICTQDELVWRAENWLKNDIKCGLTFRGVNEIGSLKKSLNVIGWKNEECFLVEAITTREDFLAYRNTMHTHQFIAENLIGNWRNFLTLPNVAKPKEIAEGWGLYVWDGKFIQHITGPVYGSCKTMPFLSNRSKEIAIMYSGLRQF